MKCIYCEIRDANGREHPVPQFLGGFKDNKPLLNRICKECNSEIGSSFEGAFARLSPVAIIRTRNSIQRAGGRKKNRISPFVPRHLNAGHLKLSGLDPESGRKIYWQLGEEPRTIREISQVCIPAKDSSSDELIPIPASITTGAELVQLLFTSRGNQPIDKAYVYAAAGDESRILGLFQSIGQTLELTPRTAGVVGDVTFECEITPDFYRGLAKIGFHFVLQNLRSHTGAESEFTEIRNFVRHGVGDFRRFFEEMPEANLEFQSPGHFLRGMVEPQGHITVDLKLFCGLHPPIPLWRLSVGNCPIGIKSRSQFAEFYSYSRNVDGTLSGDEIFDVTTTIQDEIESSD